MLLKNAGVSLILGSFAVAIPSPNQTRSSVLLPFSTKGRDILDRDGNIFYYLSTNWPGHQEIMIPEGLQHASIKEIVTFIPELGLNSVRLPFAIEMVSDIYSNSTNRTLERSVINALGESNGTIVLNQILQHNPEFTKNTTRLQVWDAVALELAKQDIIVHLDNHVSKAFWCCDENDGNGWFGEKFFNVEEWKRGLSFMAKHAKENWPTFASIGLRNELRNATDAEPYDWYTWFENMEAAAKVVHEANPDALIFFSGLNYDAEISPIPLGQTLNGTVGTSSEGKTAVFNPERYAFRNKIVLEIHKYDFEATSDDCETFKSKFYQKGFQALDPSNPETKYLFPMVQSEWGFIHNGTYWYQTTYNRCTIEMVRDWKFGWMHWDISGSFYLQTRPKRTPKTIQGLEEFWGLLDYNWSAIRSPITIENSLKKMIEALG